jgi:isoamylase
VASINFVTCHDGFTLNDLVSYNDKHNEANGEGNRDGESNNRSWNCGVEGTTDDPAVLELRARQRRNFLTTLFTSQGVPMLLHGDELGRTQNGNNNAYCQDNETTWLDWGKVDEELLEFTARLAELRAMHPVFRRRRFFDGRPVRRGGGEPLRDIAWLTPAGEEMTEEDWERGFGPSIAAFLNGNGISDRDARGERVVDDSFLLCFNAHDAPIDFHVPGSDYGEKWLRVITTAEAEPDEERAVAAGAGIRVPDRSLVVLERAV